MGEVELYVVKGLKNNLLGLPAITALNLVERVSSVDIMAMQEQFTQVF